MTQLPRSVAAALWRPLFSLTLTVGAAGCSSNSATAARPQTLHTYTLRAVGSREVPFVVSRVGTRVTELVADTLTLNPDGTYVSRTVLRDGEAAAGGSLATRTAESTGKYTLSAGVLVLTRSSGGPSATYEVTEDGAVVRGPALPSAGPALSVLEIHVYRKLAGGT